MITLVLVNYQSDFITGTMSTSKSKNVLPEIRKYIKDNAENIDRIIFVMDWHPNSHLSFKKNGGTLPVHCVQFTPGSCVEPKLLKYINSLGILCQYALKDNEYMLGDSGIYSPEEVKDTTLGSRIYFNSGKVMIYKDTEIVVCGFGKDVEYTLTSLIGFNFNPKVFIKGCYDESNELINYINNRNIEKV